MYEKLTAIICFVVSPLDFRGYSTCTRWIFLPDFASQFSQSYDRPKNSCSSRNFCIYKIPSRQFQRPWQTLGEFGFPWLVFFCNRDKSHHTHTFLGFPPKFHNLLSSNQTLKYFVSIKCLVSQHACQRLQCKWNDGHAYHTCSPRQEQRLQTEHNIN